LTRVLFLHPLEYHAIVVSTEASLVDVSEPIVAPSIIAKGMVAEALDMLPLLYNPSNSGAAVLDAISHV